MFHCVECARRARAAMRHSHDCMCTHHRVRTSMHFISRARACAGIIPRIYMVRCRVITGTLVHPLGKQASSGSGKKKRGSIGTGKSDAGVAAAATTAAASASSGHDESRVSAQTMSACHAHTCVRVSSVNTKKARAKAGCSAWVFEFCQCGSTW